MRQKELKKHLTKLIIIDIEHHQFWLCAREKEGYDKLFYKEKLYRNLKPVILEMIGLKEANEEVYREAWIFLVYLHLGKNYKNKDQRNLIIEEFVDLAFKAVKGEKVKFDEALNIGRKRPIKVDIQEYLSSVHEDMTPIS